MNTRTDNRRAVERQAVIERARRVFIMDEVVTLLAIVDEFDRSDTIDWSREEILQAVLTAASTNNEDMDRFPSMRVDCLNGEAA